MGLIRLEVFAFLGLSVVYGIVWVYSRSVRREKLEESWDADPENGDDNDARDAYIQKGMAEYHAGLRPKLILLVYVIPAALMIGLLITTNWN